MTIPNTSPLKTVLIAAGGTGGHVIPALVLAHELQSRGIKIVFATDTRGARFIPDADRSSLNMTIIRAGTLRKHPVQLVKDLWALSIGVLQSFDIIRNHRPHVVVGFGGYPSFPPVFAGQILRLPTLIHSADAVVGQANRMLATFCTRLALSFPNFQGLSEKLKAKTIVTGLPIRAEIDAMYETPYTPPAPEGPFHILVLGGSQGAGILGEPLARMFCALPDPDRARLRLTHQVRPEGIDSVRALYAANGITATCAPFIDNIPEQLKSTHLFIGRSGASTVTEISLAGIPAIFIPLIAATHKDAQQRDNARTLATPGAAILIEETDFNVTNFLAPLTRLMHDPGQLGAMAALAKDQAHPHATQALASAVLSIAK